jgi:hypothetical protein
MVAASFGAFVQISMVCPPNITIFQCWINHLSENIYSRLKESTIFGKISRKFAMSGINRSFLIPGHSDFF